MFTRTPDQPPRRWIGLWQDNLLARARNTKLPMLTRLLYAVESRVTGSGHAVFKVGELADILGYCDADGVIHPYTETRKLLAKAVDAGVLIDSRPPGSRGPIRCIQVSSGLRCALGSEQSRCSWCVEEESKDGRYRARQAQSAPEKNQEQNALTRGSAAIPGLSAPTERVPGTHSSRNSGCGEPAVRTDLSDLPAITGLSEPTVPTSDDATTATEKGTSRRQLVEDEAPATSGPSGTASSGHLVLVKDVPSSPEDVIDPDEYEATLEWVRQTALAEGIT